MAASLPSLAPVRDVRSSRRRFIRYVAAAASLATAVLYFGIGAGVLVVVDVAASDAPGMFEFGASAGAAFVLGALLLLALDHRGLWLVGALLQVGVIVMYIAVGPQRTPSFEVWGLVIKALQVVILVALAWLTVRPPTRVRAR
ncbi:MAG: hypothetical protein WEE50_03065 [Chloroflexota bacterium]